LAENCHARDGSQSPFYCGLIETFAGQRRSDPGSGDFFIRLPSFVGGSQEDDPVSAARNSPRHVRGSPADGSSIEAMDQFSRAAVNNRLAFTPTSRNRPYSGAHTTKKR
jgi:hypothetical protein